ncbi:MAG: MFS transporter [Silvibacterium sp.]
MVPLPEDNGRLPVQFVICLHLGFVLTGIGTVLLGCVLPVLSGPWTLNDSRSGFLLAAQFTGSSCGALLVQSTLYASLIRGYLLLIAGGVSIAFCHGHFAVPLFFIFGLGLGSAMTATSMLVGRIYSATRGSALSLLNASWCLGAVICPPIVTIWVHSRSPASLFLAMGCAGALSVFFAGLQHSHLSRLRDDFMGPQSLRSKFSTLMPLGLFAFLYVGVETSISSWMMTFVYRLHLPSTVLAPTATSFFWIALLFGRAIAPAVLKKMTESRLLTICLSLTLVSSFQLLLSHTFAMSLTSALLAGLMLAPIFPLCLARVLAITSRASESKWVFGFSGLGGAVFPWMTGQVATIGGSLRTGLMVPFFASCLMLFLHLRAKSISETLLP